MNSVAAIIISELVIFFLSFFLMNYLTNNYVFTFIKAKASRGKKCVLEIYSINGVYCRTGEFKEAKLEYRNRAKVLKQITGATKEFVHHKFGVAHVYLDEVGDKLLKPDFTGATGHDGARVDNYLVRAITAPSLEQDKLLKACLLLIIVEFVALIVIGFLVFKTTKDIGLVKEMVAAQSDKISSLVTQTKGVI